MKLARLAAVLSLVSTLMYVPFSSAWVGTHARRDIRKTASSPIISLLKSTNATFNSSSTLNIPAPTGVPSGIVLVAIVSASYSNFSSAPSGWTLQRSDQSPSTTLRTSIYTHVTTSSEPAIYTWTAITTTELSGVILAYTGVNTTSPVDVVNGLTGSFTTTVTAPSVTTSGGPRTLIGIFANDSALTTTVPGAFIQKAAASSATGIYMAIGEQSLTSAGTYGPYTTTLASSADTIGQLLALNPTSTTGGGGGCASSKQLFATASSSGTPNFPFVVPSGCTSITVKLWGAGGGGANSSGVGGGGGYANATISVTPGETLMVTVGGGGAAPSSSLTTGGAGGYPTGGTGGNGGTTGSGGGGGGAHSSIARGSTALIIAAGGGGAAKMSISGGGGGGSSGVSGSSGGGGTGGGPGMTSSGGSAGTGGSTLATSGQWNGTSASYGGNGGSATGSSSGGGGGGGGWGGGGGGGAGTNGGGGGGGSSYVTGPGVSGSTTAATGASPYNTSDPDYAGNAGKGGSTGTSPGNAGLVVISTP